MRSCSATQSGLMMGIQNTRFFHNMTKFRQSNHFIFHLNIDGEIEYNQSAIASHIVQHFTNLFTGMDNQSHNLSMVDDITPLSISSTMSAKLAIIPNEAEVQAMVFSMDASSSLGPDGFGGAFYHACWNVIKHDIIKAVQTFFNHKYLPHGLNSSTVILLPKKSHDTSISDFRLIVLFNFLFKIISKIMVVRLGGVANEIISANQFGFIQGRNIHDCITLGSEGVNCMENSAKEKNMACKIDISKAFDTMS